MIRVIEIENLYNDEKNYRVKQDVFEALSGQGLRPTFIKNVTT